METISGQEPAQEFAQVIEVQSAPTAPPVTYTSASNHKFFSKKNILVGLFLLILIVTLPVGVYLVQKQQTIKSKAAAGIQTFIKISGAEANCDPDAISTAKLNCTPLKTGEIKITFSPADANYVSGTDTSNQPAAFATPSDLNFKCIAIDQVQLTWKAVEGAGTYHYSVSGPNKYESATTTNVVPSMFISAGQKYSWSVYVEGKAGGPGQSATATGEFSCDVSKPPDNQNPPASQSGTPSIPAAPSRLMLDGGSCTKNASGDTWTAGLSWEGITATDHYNWRLNGDTGQVKGAYKSFDTLATAGYAWWVQACNLQNQCSEWVKGPNFVCELQTP